MGFSTNDLWGRLGELEDDDVSHVLTGLFALYEKKLQQNEDDKNAELFFLSLDQILTQVSECNLNRR